MSLTTPRPVPTRLCTHRSSPIFQCPPPLTLPPGVWGSCNFCISKLPYLITPDILNLFLKISLRLLLCPNLPFHQEHCFRCSTLPYWLCDFPNPLLEMGPLLVSHWRFQTTVPPSFLITFPPPLKCALLNLNFSCLGPKP